MLTREQMSELRKPFQLHEHTVREGFKNAAKTKIRWFVYIDRSAIADRLDDMFLGEWGMAEPQIHIQDKKVSAVVGITIDGVTRYDGGEDDSDEGTKGALTNAFRRTAAYGWGIARYLYDMDYDIWTDAYPQGDWDAMRARKQEAFKKFEDWYKKQFLSVGSPTQTNPFSGAPASPAPKPAENAANGTPEQEIKWLQTPLQSCFGAFKQYVLLELYGNNTFAMNGSLEKRGIVVKVGKQMHISSEWATKSAGAALEYLKHRHDDDQLPESA